MGNYLFGAVYVVEEDYSDEEMVRDLTNMKNCGYNLVTLWPISNAWLAKSCHEFVFDKTRRVLDICDQLGMKCVLQLFGQNQSQEFMPDAALTVDMEDHDELGGDEIYENAFWSNLNNPVVREYFDTYFKTAINALKDHPAVYAWDVFNESRFRSDDRWTTMCYQRWLKEKYKDITILNHDWNRRYGAFSQITPNKRRAGYSVWSSLLPAIDYEKFRSENLLEINTFLKNTAKKYDKVHPIMIDGISSLIIRNTLLMRNSDEFATAEIPDHYGATFYPKSWGRNYKDTPWMLSMYYTIPSSAARKAKKPYVINELQTHTQSALTPGSEVSVEEMRNWIWMCLFTAPKSIQLWRWRPFLHGYQVTGRGLTQFDGTPNKRSEEVEKLLSIVNSHQELFNDFTIKKPVVRMAVSYANRLAFDSLLKWKNSFWGIDVEGWYRLFWELGLPVEFTNMEDFDERDFSTPIMILPIGVQLNEKEIKDFKSYVENGGLLIADCRMGILNEKAIAPKEGIPGKELSKLFGFVEKDVSSGEKFVIGDKTFASPYMNQILDVDKNCNVLAKMESGSPAIIEHPYGKGKTLYFNSMLGVKLKEEVPNEIKEIIKPYLKSIDCISAEKEKTTHVSYLESKTHNGMLVINFANNSTDCSLSGIHTASENQVINIINNEKISVIEDKIKLHLEPNSCQVYIWKKV